MSGASYGYPADLMSENGLRVRERTNPRARLYFTEAGWRQVGRPGVIRLLRLESCLWGK